VVDLGHVDKLRLLVDILSDLNFIAGAVAGDTPPGDCRRLWRLK